MRPEELKRHLCNTFCAAINVQPVRDGLAVSSAFKDSSGDPISFYLTTTPDGFQIEDDGDYLSHLIAKGIPIDQGQREQLLDSILSQASAYWDRETFEIKSGTFPAGELYQRAVDFLSSLIRIRDLELLTREVVRSTFREDAIAALEARFGKVARVEQDAPISKEFAEFPADLVIRPKAPDTQPGAIYLVNNNDKLSEALLLQTEAQVKKRLDFAVVALIEDAEMKLISRKRFQRAQNRSLPMPIFRGDEDAAMDMIGRELKLAA
jgi:hypothetical protein